MGSRKTMCDLRWSVWRMFTTGLNISSTWSRIVRTSTRANVSGSLLSFLFLFMCCIVTRFWLLRSTVILLVISGHSYKIVMYNMVLFYNWYSKTQLSARIINYVLVDKLDFETHSTLQYFLLSFGDDRSLTVWVWDGVFYYLAVMTQNRKVLVHIFIIHV